MKKNSKIILSGGGTGGHIYPAIAIANELKIRYSEVEILFVGAEDKMEMQKVPQAGYPIKGLWIAGIQRKLTLQNIIFPLKLISSLFKSFLILKKFKPDVVIGTGGFASGAVLKVASMLGIPTLIQEQNSYPGITNKLLSKKANTICVAYENLERFFPKDKMILTGNFGKR
jgi:UDP-N-acetylglucosamine--N-acetylmuramyl-(pentapeptide) pyrophosphoryl-undecaprenol N-acetylglucosamine transferase